MDGEKILEVTAKYRKFFEKNKVQCTSFPHPRKPKTNEEILRHCYGMLLDVEKFVREGRLEKAFRWLGFIQGCLWSVGSYSIYDLKNHNKPKKSKKWFWCKLGFHRYDKAKLQRTKNLCFGPARAELPGLREVKVCKYCSQKSYTKLNLYMPNKYLYREYIWKD